MTLHNATNHAEATLHWVDNHEVPGYKYLVVKVLNEQTQFLHALNQGSITIGVLRDRKFRMTLLVNWSYLENSGSSLEFFKISTAETLEVGTSMLMGI